MSLHHMEYALCGPQTKMKYILATIVVLAAAKENPMSQLPLYQQAFHVNCAMRFNSREDLKQHTIEKHTGNR
jgi:hypothetical protein